MTPMERTTPMDAQDADPLEQELGQRLRSGPEDRSAEAARRVAERADREALLDIAYAEVESPLGPLLAVATERGLVRLSYGNQAPDAVLEQLARTLSPRILEAPWRLDRARRELDEYFAGRRREFEIPIDWRVLRGFTRRVLEATARIPYGQVATYRDVATVAESPLAVRAAGNALSANPIPIVVPCHRVVRTGGGLGGYTGGLTRKEFLLTLEGARAA